MHLDLRARIEMVVLLLKCQMSFLEREGFKTTLGEWLVKALLYVVPLGNKIDWTKVSEIAEKDLVTDEELTEAYEDIQQIQQNQQDQRKGTVVTTYKITEEANEALEFTMSIMAEQLNMKRGVRKNWACAQIVRVFAIHYLQSEYPEIILSDLFVDESDLID